MSLTSAYELSQDPAFRAKVLMATVNAARKVIDENGEKEDQISKVTFAKSVLGNARNVAETITVIVASDPKIDSSSSDAAIQDAVVRAVISLIS